MILLSDANVLIDLGHVGGLSLLARLAPTEVLDVVLLECEHASQPGLIDVVRSAGVREVATQTAWVRTARAYRSDALSLQDRLNLVYARDNGRVLLGGDRPLRERCVAEGVEVHGSLWLVERAFALELVSPSELCRWLQVWPTLDRRLPIADLKRLNIELGCT